MKRSTVVAIGAVAVAGLATSAFAHPGHSHETQSVFSAGVAHPVFGIDHLLAALASGLLAVRVGTKKALWAIPAAFVGLMILGGLTASRQWALPGAEWAIAASVIILGVMVAAMPKVPMWIAATLVGAFALCHGHAHVAELAPAGSLLSYTAGFAMTTALLHAAVIALGLGMIKIKQPVVVRVAGAVIAVAFAAMLSAGMVD
jgi:urease accessory protein